ncbi:WS/DGAT domain-containing protein [Geodermatophilus sp. YIM 151500]|uniref:wax ester/triacylglycerol synthase domain-containing protein n=1 Tax=Geodermatophilus sp. YIM 151500 TaxID=2984531 RepID=UPI0021E4522C|nr:wax ester/triacylglycerol synthase domain-containing protein [Geodermatophilus sp. YIM 151500]MCV2488228.1 WS/DGAT domain-containing protein [Geodermatophilus sp. YIM 151500]
MQVPLTAEDRAILALEGPQLVGHTCKVIRLPAGAPDVAELRDAVARRLPAAPRLTWRLSGAADAPVWLPDEAVDVAAHVGAVRTDAPLDAAGLRREVARLFVQHLDRSRPLWRMDLVGPLAGGGAALVWRVHHALADGTTVVRLARDVLWDPAPAPAPRAAPEPATAAGAELASPAGAELASPAGAGPASPAGEPRRHDLAGLLSGELLPGLRRSPFDARVGRDRAVAFAAAPLPDLHDAARTLAGATVNDAVLAVLAGALRRWLEHRHGPIHALRVKVPVTLHHPGDAAGNRDSWFRVDLPVDEPDVGARLAAVRTETALRKSRHDAQELDELMARLARFSPHLARWSERLQRSGRAFALNVSNVRGPDRPVTVLGAPVDTMHSLAEVAQHHALRVAVVSVADRLCFGFVADPAVVDDVDVLAAALEREASELVRAAAPS